jgi:hypothetical protein
MHTPYTQKLSATGLFEEAFELAESLLRNGEKYTNRIERSVLNSQTNLDSIGSFFKLMLSQQPAHCTVDQLVSLSHVYTRTVTTL